MNIKQMIESYTYARVTASSSPLDHIDNKALEIIGQQREYLKKTLDVLFSPNEYEARLRYIQREKTHN
jgi:hypothetical protein